MKFKNIKVNFIVKSQKIKMDFVKLLKVKIELQKIKVSFVIKF